MTTLDLDRLPSFDPSRIPTVVSPSAREPRQDDTNTIPEGRRNDTLARLAGVMRRRGAPVETILAALMAENARCDPALDVEEVESIAASIGRYDPARTYTPVDDVAVATRKVPPALVDGVLSCGSFAYCYSPPGVGKTTLSVGLGLGIAAGRDVLGLGVPHAGPVVALVAEGSGFYGGPRPRVVNCPLCRR